MSLCFKDINMPISDKSPSFNRVWVSLSIRSPLGPYGWCHGLRFCSKCTNRPKHLLVSIGVTVTVTADTNRSNSITVAAIQDGKTEKWRKVNFLDRNRRDHNHHRFFFSCFWSRFEWSEFDRKTVIKRLFSWPAASTRSPGGLRATLIFQWGVDTENWTGLQRDEVCVMDLLSLGHSSTPMLLLGSCNRWRLLASKLYDMRESDVTERMTGRFI